MAKRKKAAAILRRKPRSWLGIGCAVFSLAALAFSRYDVDMDGKLTSRTQMFESFAELDVDVEAVTRMRASPPPPRQKPLSTAWHIIVEAMDGDTFRLDNGETVRLIGVDAPESSVNRKVREDIYKTGMAVSEGGMVKLGKAAAAYAKQITEGRQCWLEFESNPRDQYGRYLAYIHLRDGSIVNEEMIANGYAKAYLNVSFKYKKRYIFLQAEASMRKRGLWQDDS